MARPWPLRLVPLLPLPPALASGAETAPTSTVVLLLVLLLLLLLGLALAWRRLSRDSEGRYHPTRLGATALRRARRLAGTTLDRLWRRRGRGRRGLPGGEELGEDDDDHDDDDDDDDEGQQEEEEEEEAPRPERQPDEATAGAEEEQEMEDDDDEKVADGREDQGPAGSAGVLLSDLHAFSGSAVWGAVDGDGLASDQGPSVTAL
ncbi:protein tyrosine phosphatase receptor type C-associated protein [Tachyglossus aculeatus]|uniref:protein tyrosine phosphatase receptor type C-associated protein n=1 Tax=Tachyglossus aculeatus TaxID=9261 RepID=UPI0018F706BB|nr:protein tyrosine phosphatase receptor type C-associated protein [Tachyglossus aculeatus]